MRNRLLGLLAGGVTLVGSTFAASNYSVDATMSLQKDEGVLDVEVRVSRLAQKDGESVEELVSAPRIKTAPGVPATCYTGLQPSDPRYNEEQNVTVDVSWPFPNESGTAYCLVSIREGKSLVSRCKLQLKVEGPGRVPLVLEAAEMEHGSIQIVPERANTCVLFEFRSKSAKEVKKLAVENYGNKVQIRDAQGRVTEAGLSFGTYHEHGLCLQFETAAQAQKVVSWLSGKPVR